MKRQLVSAAALALGVSGCVVPKPRYDEAMAKLGRETGQRKAAEETLDRMKADLTRLEEVLTQREQSLSENERDLATANLEISKTSTERDDATELVEQLRSDLGRAGENVRELADKKKELETALDEADQRAKRLEATKRRMTENALVMRDLSLALADAVSSRHAVVTVVDGKPAARLDAREAFDDKGMHVRPGGKAMLERIALALSSRRQAHIELADLSTDGAADEDRIARLQLAADVLVGKGVPADRIGLTVAPHALEAVPEIAPPDPDRPPGAASPTEAHAAELPRVRSPEEATAKTSPSEIAFWEGPGSIEITVNPSPS